jgi:hypothetical protein
VLFLSNWDNGDEVYRRISFGLRHLIPLLSENAKKRGFGAKNRGFNPLFWRV